MKNPLNPEHSQLNQDPMGRNSMGSKFNPTPPVAYLSLSLYDRSGLAPNMTVLFWDRQAIFQKAWLKHGYLVERLKWSFRRFYGRYGILFNNMNYFSLTNVKWHSDHTDQTFHLFHEINTELDLHRITSDEFLGAFVWHANKKRLPFHNLVPSLLGFAGVSMLRPGFRNLPCLFWTFYLELYFLDFTSYHLFVLM